MDSNTPAVPTSENVVTHHPIVETLVPEPEQVRVETTRFPQELIDRAVVEEPTPTPTAGNTTQTLAPTPVEKAAEEAPKAEAPARTEYVGTPKTNLAPQAQNAHGKSRYAADGLTIDWFDTHPRK